MAEASFSVHDLPAQVPVTLDAHEAAAWSFLQLLPLDESPAARRGLSSASSSRWQR